MHIFRLSVILLIVAVCQSYGKSTANEIDNSVVMNTQAVRLMQEGKPAEALPLLVKGEKQYAANNDTISKEFVTAFLLPQFKCYRQMELYREATAVAYRITVITEKSTIRSEIRPDHTEQLSQRAEANLQKPKDGEDTTGNSSPVSYILVIVCICLAIYAVMATACFMYYIIQCRRNDKARTMIIDRMRRYKHILYGISKDEIADPEHNQEAMDILLSQPGITDDERTFYKLTSTIVHKKMYLNPNLSREDVTQEVYVPKNKFGNIFKTYAGITFKAYITNLRIDEAIALMKQYPNYTIETIASECGMPSIQTFYRTFAENTGMTPAEYRSNLQGKTKNPKITPPRPRNSK